MTEINTVSEVSTVISSYLLEKHAEHVKAGKKGALMVSMQGPQGAGKSTVAAAIKALLCDGEGLKVAVVSLDDFYLTHDGLTSLSTTNPTNKLLHGRGQPGTHDVEFLLSTLQQINSAQGVVHLPIFDKSRFSGEGDRSEETVEVEVPLDVFILEGWSMGFEPLDPTKLEEIYIAASTNPSPKPPLFLSHSLPSLLEINTLLQHFSSTIYPLFDLQLTIRPLSFSFVYTWRQQQEHHMKSLNGGKGMDDDGVRRFVDRYMPAYELFASEEHYAKGKEGRWAGGTLELMYGERRELVSVTRG